MFQLYQGGDFQFLYPEGWTLEETRTPDGLTTSLQSPYSMFVFLHFLNRAVPVQELADEALASMAEEYPEVESEAVWEKIGDKAATGYNVNFFSLDLTNTCWIRAIAWGSNALLIFAQTNDLDLEEAELAFRGICASLKLGKTGVG